MRKENDNKLSFPSGHNEETPLWIKCHNCDQIIYRSVLESSYDVCPTCNFHFPMTASARIQLLADEGTFAEMDADMTSCDPLYFAGDGRYTMKLEDTRQSTGLKDAVICGSCKISGFPAALAVMDFRFFGASMGSVVGEKITRLIEYAMRTRRALVIVTASGGARMQEGILSLMQMAKTSAALMRYSESGLPYIVVLTNPTTGGVTASFASLGDVIFAEPKALIGFAGPRVIKQTTKAELPPGFQTSEFLLEHGFVDRVVERTHLKSEIAQVIGAFRNVGGK